MKRDYLQEQKIFFHNYQADLSADACLLWYQLFNIHNLTYDPQAKDWCYWVGLFNEDLCDLLKTKGNRRVSAARDELIAAGLLEYQRTGPKKPSLYHLRNLVELEEEKREIASEEELSKRANQHVNEICKSANQHVNEIDKRVNQHVNTPGKRANQHALININKLNITTLLVNGTTTLRDFYLEHRGIGLEEVNEKLANSRLETLIAHGKRPEDFETVILKAENSEYIQGRKKEGTFRPSLEWLLKEDIFKRILDGQFDDWKKSTEPKSYRSPVREKQYEEALQADYDWFYGDLAND